LIPKILDTIINLEDELIKSDINKKEADIDEVCGFLEKLKI
jgi:hypothetical protein